LPSFQFPLAAVLRLRERVQEAKETELRALNLEAARHETIIAHLSAELDRLGDELSAQTGQIISPAELKWSADYAQSLARRIEQAEQSLAKLRDRVAQQQQELIEAMRDVKSLEILRRRLEEKFRHGQDLAERKFLDELGQRKFLRQGRRQ
jgi:flagellar export protein FliJ